MPEATEPRAPKRMRILELVAENVKKLSVVEIRPTGDLVQICGPNSSGKTSVLDSIWWALSGTTHIQAQPIKKGANTARIRLDLGDIVVTRKFAADKAPQLIVENSDGARYPSPQRMLDDLIGALSFDPLAFTRMEPRRQFEALRSVVTLDVDIDELDRLNKGAYEQRTDVNRETKRLQAQLDGIPRPAEDLPDEPIDTAALVAEIARAGEHNAGIERRKERREQLARDVADLRSDAQEARDRAAELRRQAEAADEEARQLEERAAADQMRLDEAPPLPEPLDAEALQRQLKEAGAVNAWIARRKERENLERTVAASEAKAAELTAAMEARETAKRDAIAAAKMPVEGVSFGAGAVLYNGLPFEQASSAEQLRVSCAIAMAMNPKLRVLRIKDGSLLDEDGLRILAEMAAANDFQVWIETVHSDNPMSIVMEDGTVKGTPAPPPADEESSVAAPRRGRGQPTVSGRLI